MERPKQPADIARAAIRLLGERRLQPTPDNFLHAYAEVSGEGVSPVVKPEEAKLRWADAIRPLIKQMEAHQAGLTPSKKREMLERVLINFGHDSGQLFEKLCALAKSWSESGGGSTVLEEVTATPAAIPAGNGGAKVGALEQNPLQASAKTPASPVMPDLLLRQALADNLRMLAQSCAPRWPDLGKRAELLAATLAASVAASDEHMESLAALWREFMIRAEDDHELSVGLRRLIALLFLNMGELVGDETWFSGQMTAMQTMIAGNLNTETVHGTEIALRELVFKQGMIKGSLDDAREKLRSLISTFIDRIGTMSDDADGYHARIGAYSEQIGQANDIGELGTVVEGLSRDMDGMRQALRLSHNDLQEARAQAEQAEERIRALETELIQTASLVREDQLTGALNRRGLDEALAREMARADRLLAPLSVSLLDIDHFKKLNDSLGHQAGDAALQHLTRVVRDFLRPTDTLARYGGEEFLILLPNTELDEAEKTLTRLQRELTRQFFLHDNNKVLITFSAGIAERLPEESQEALVARVDAAMYRAKSAGRNRVERG